MTGASRVLNDPKLARLLAALAATGRESRVVGGAVRDALLGLEPHEIDIATAALPEAVAKAAQDAGLKVVPTGLAHGTMTVVVEGTPFEVTTLREDVETYGRAAKVRFGADFENRRAAPGFHRQRAVAVAGRSPFTITPAARPI